MNHPTRRISHPTHLKRHYANWPLRILHARHSGKRVHNQHTSYPVLAILILATGFILLQSTINAYAASTTISVNVYNPNPTGQAQSTAGPTGSDSGLRTIDWVWMGFGILGAGAVVLWLGELTHAGTLAGIGRHHRKSKR